MSDIFSEDLFEICGCHIPISSIKEYRLGQIEYIMRPVYIEREASKWGGLFKKAAEHKIEFFHMEYYAAIIGETKYKNAIEEASANNVFEAVFKSAALGISDAISDLTRHKVAKSIRYTIMNAAWRVSQRTLEEIPAVLQRIDGKRSEVFPRDDLYPLLGEPIAPTIVMIPALFITATDGRYVFFGNGIQSDDITQEYERLKIAIQSVRELQVKKGTSGFLHGIFAKPLVTPKTSFPLLHPAKKNKTPENKQNQLELPQNDKKD